MQEITQVNELFQGYAPLSGVYDEYVDFFSSPHPHVEQTIRLFQDIGLKNIKEHQNRAEKIFRKKGVTFNVYNHAEGFEKIFPFDVLPRILFQSEWERLEKGLMQRITALNIFLHDFYSGQEIVKAGRIPRMILHSSKNYYPQLHGIHPPKNIYVHIAGIDLIRTPEGEFCVLEDNLRCPSGVSYVLENRKIMQEIFPSLFQQQMIKTVSQYPLKLRCALSSLTNKEEDEICAVLLSPGSYNSAYFEHLYLAGQMGYELVTGEDLFVDDEHVYLKTTQGPKQVDVIYRRIDDDFLDPAVFRKDSVLGVPGIMEVYAKGNVVLANAFGNGIADDKGVYPYIPEIIRFYLSEEPILKQVPTYQCFFDKDREYVLKNLESLVVKNVNASGGYDMMFGSRSTVEERQACAKKINQNPRQYIAQPIMEISTCPTFEYGKLAPKRVDLRPYVITGESNWILPGGLTRVAIEKNSYIVNSSQGGGSKDTWILSGG